MKYQKLLIPVILIPNLFSLYVVDAKNVIAKKDKKSKKSLLDADLYDDAQEMLDSALLMYPWSLFRKWAKQQKLPLDFLQEGISAAQFLELVNLHREEIDALVDYDDDDLTLELNALESIAARHQGNEQETNAVLLEFNDDNSDSELVYAVGVDNLRKRITVSFRGSSNTSDWIHNLQAWMTKMPNRMVDYRNGQPKDINIHKGFYKYLFSGLSASEIQSNKLMEDDQLSKFEEIVGMHVLPELKNRSGYELFVTGHSLGAALATLFAFQASAGNYPGIIYPVTCVSFASPYVGDQNFREAFSLAEELGLLRHLRVANEKDIVASLPFLSLSPWDWFSGKALFKHVGLNLRLPDTLSIDKVCDFKYAGSTGSIWDNSVVANFPGFNDETKINHSPSEYDKRLKKCKGVLLNTSLDEVYRDYAPW